MIRLGKESLRIGYCSLSLPMSKSFFAKRLNVAYGGYTLGSRSMAPVPRRWKRQLPEQPHVLFGTACERAPPER